MAATDGNLWITTYWRGVDYFDKKAGKFIHYNTQTVPGLASDNIWSVVDGGDGSCIWGMCIMDSVCCLLKIKK